MSFGDSLQQEMARRFRADDEGRATDGASMTPRRPTCAISGLDSTFVERAPWIT